ncbi:hypothetical protein EWM64_g4388 [Hericium alpestre]|uniref:Uncharacterized protein n=1 Tax=Hericium alpestre TaxID=135208 RepID=A0A4Y9ZZN1_9AGAM|nr:hypothetical protein EWM64_g4388 [Hericium alpestre]
MSSDAQNHDGHHSDHYTGETISKSDIANLVQDFLRRCILIYPDTDMNRFSDLTAACEAVSTSRGYITLQDDSFRKFIPAGVAMGYIGYAHHPDGNVQLYISLYTAFLIYCDDMFENDILAVQEEFNGRFMMGQPQRHWILDPFETRLTTSPRSGPI